MIQKLRLWLQHRTLFFFTDIEEDEGNRTMAASIVNNLEPDLTQLQVKMKAHRLIVMVVHRLLSTGEIDYHDRPKMRFRVAKLKIAHKATSENLPAGSEDLALNLEICDQIRSKQVSPKDAAKALKRRIGHKNPNVQLLALGLTDVCVKNGGHHFLVEVASREFIDNLTSIMKAPAGCNYEVKNRILALIQTWGLLFRGKHGLGYVCDTYMILQHEGFQFPPKDNVGAALVESEAPPDWTDSDVCTRCRNAFTLTNRKHHCRACGSTFCGQCSSKTMALPNMGVTQEVRVCDGCWMKKKLGPKSVLALESHGLGGGIEIVPSASKPGSSSYTPSKTTTTPSNNPSNSASKSAAEAEDADLLKAIELSLKEANNQPGYSAPKRSNTEPAKKAPVQSEEEEDADLLAAIEASLRETNIHSSSSASASRSGQRQSSYSSYTFQKKPITSGPSPTELTETEKSNIEMFATLVDRIQLMQGDVSGNREVQALYEQISKLQMKVALSLEEAARKQQEFVGFNEKIDHAVRIYDHLLQERLNSSYQRRMNANSYGHSGVGLPPPGSAQGMYSHTTAPQTPQSSHVYPQIAPQDSRYSHYVPASGVSYSSAPTQQQTPQIPYQAPYQQQPQLQQQASYQYQPAQTQQPGGSAPYSVTSPIQQDQQPPLQTQFSAQNPTPQLQAQPAYVPQQQVIQQQQVQPVASAAQYAATPAVNGQTLALNNAYQPNGPSIQSPPQQPQQPIQVPPSAQQTAYVPYEQPQQFSTGPAPQAPLQYASQPQSQSQPQPQIQQQQQTTHQAISQQQPLPQPVFVPVQPKVEEAPLIDL
ncbi:Vacuolar protein-sorting-associated protein 27 [Mortierella alpina]|nr:Vacuolar protein-sorting-associated protein 27 [Mortierella alpina]